MLHRQLNLFHFLNEIRSSFVKSYPITISRSLLRAALLSLYCTMTLITPMANWKNNEVSNELRNLQYMNLADRTKAKQMI